MILNSYNNVIKINPKLEDLINNTAFYYQIVKLSLIYSIDILIILMYNMNFSG